MGNINVITYAQNYTDGYSNTSTINNTANVTTSAAVSCYNSTVGGTTAGTWYLPAICQMFGDQQNVPCPSNLPNIDTDLVQLGFGELAGVHWSSTEYEYYDGTEAWLGQFDTNGNTFQDVYDKSDSSGFVALELYTFNFILIVLRQIRKARSLTFFFSIRFNKSYRFWWGQISSRSCLGMDN